MILPLTSQPEYHEFKSCAPEDKQHRGKPLHVKSVRIKRPPVEPTASIAEGSRYRIVAGLVTKSGLLPLKTRRAGNDTVFNRYSTTVFSDEESLFAGMIREESNDEMYNSFTEIYPDNFTEEAIIVLDKRTSSCSLARKT
ncbi:hypothetical protein TNCV_642931 [Trichonephila clavipes]|nr:hypothetical protein TNCV_642931 [Trichonephila clavipes]